jgi:hypothetical protein
MERIKLRHRPRTLSELVARNMARPDLVPTPPVDLIQILMGQP